ncbi:prolyl aminopeptidase OS=Lysinibacillus sphaericus OX=1421 GN=LS41612_11605 PE=3 SV=1 [Lysinibacillus sphaericus]
MFAAINGTKIYFDVEGSGYIPLRTKNGEKTNTFCSTWWSR